MNTTAGRPTRDSAALWSVVVIAIALFALHMALNNRYDLHRDELAIVDYAAHLDWGYVEFPPLTPALVRLAQTLFGDSLRALRLFSALAQSLAVLWAGLMAFEMGGRRAAPIVAAAAAAVGFYALLSGSMTQYASFDYAWWVGIFWAVSRLCTRRDPRGWLLVGLFFGLGLLTKYTILVLAAALAVAMLLTPLRRDLRSPWLWAGAALALLMAAPNLWWQARHGWVAIEFTQAIHARDIEWGRTESFLIDQLYAFANPLLLPLWLGGLVWLFSPRGRPWRALAWMALAAFVLFWALEGRSYYMAGVYPALLAAGAVGLEQIVAERRPGVQRAVWATVVLLLVVGGTIGALLALPIAPVDSALWELSAATHDVFREQQLWPELVAATAEAWGALTPEQQAATGIFTAAYGEAGAINRYGAAAGLPRAFTSVNTYWLWGPPDPVPTSLLVVGYRSEWLDEAFVGCREAARAANPLGIENEVANAPIVYFCEGTTAPIDALWPQAQRFS